MGVLDVMSCATSLFSLQFLKAVLYAFPTISFIWMCIKDRKMTRKVYFVVFLLYHLIQLALYVTKLAMAGFDLYHPTRKEYRHIRDICDEMGR